MRPFYFLAAAFYVAAISVHASPASKTKQEKSETTGSKTQHIFLGPGSTTSIHAVFVHTPWPDYPYEARLRQWTGNGRVRVYLNEQGTVTNVELLKSTGHPVLDEEALKAFRHWLGKSGPSREVDTPFIFTIRPATR